MGLDILPSRDALDREIRLSCTAKITNNKHFIKKTNTFRLFLLGENTVNYAASYVYPHNDTF